VTTLPTISSQTSLLAQLQTDKQINKVAVHGIKAINQPPLTAYKNSVGDIFQMEDFVALHRKNEQHKTVNRGHIYMTLY